MTIRFRILFACMLMTVATVALGSFALRGERQLGELTFSMYDKTFMAMNFVRSAEMKLANLRSRIATSQAVDVTSERQRLLAKAAGTGSTAESPPERDSLPAVLGDIKDDLDIALERAPSDATRTSAASLGQEIAAMTANMTLLTPQRLNVIAGEFEQAVELFAQSGFEDRTRAAAHIDDLLHSMLIAIAASVLAAVLVALGLSHAIVPVLKRAAHIAQRIAEGRLDNVVPSSAQKGRSEAARLLAALAHMQEAIGDNQRMVDALHGSEKDQLARAEAERAGHEATRTAASKALAQVVGLLAEGLKRLAAGDLTFRLDDELPATYEVLRTDFNAAMGKLEDTMRSVTASTSAIRSGTGEISTAADDLSRRTEQQAAALEETAAALDEITATVRRTAEGSRHARAVVGMARGSAETSGRIVHQAVEAMSGIERSARQITQIIGVIDEIAFQTNLLALNAGVEAARAGDAGRGFAVVASEVRGLAQRSAEAAREIKGLISTSGRQVEQGVAFVGQTGEALARIVAEVAEIDGIVGEIAASAQEQAVALDEVNTAINQMDQVTQQNAAMVEETTAASHALATEVGGLTRLVGMFRVGTMEPAPRLAASGRPLARPSVSPVRALRTVGRGGAARVPEPASDSWEEF